MPIHPHNDPSDQEIKVSDFGNDFIWGTATSAYQIEGATDRDGRGPCIWDTFSQKWGKIKDKSNANTACDFYQNFETDLTLVSGLGFKNLRISLSWSRLMPNGTGPTNPLGIEFYHKVLDKCLDLGIVPWITLYHWDLPQSLEDKGGWKNRDIIKWFSDYTQLCVSEYGRKVKNWIVMNEPMATAGLGYTTGIHAPGKRGLWNFLPVVHHLNICQAEAGRIIRRVSPNSYIGTALSCSYVEPYSHKEKDLRAARRADAVMNRLFIEPALGLGYPSDAFPFLAKIKKYMRAGDDELMTFNFDFIGLQNYFNVVVKHAWLVPVLRLLEISAAKRNKPVTAMGWEISPDGLYQIIKQFNQYEGIGDILISENGAAFRDEVSDGKVADNERIDYFKLYLGGLLRARRDGLKVKGYFVWTFMDNFEWAEGYSVKFGLVHVDFQTQKRIMKNSGKWFINFLKGN